MEPTSLIRRALRTVLSERQWERLKTTYRSSRTSFVRRYRSFGPDELLSALRDVGVEPGRVVMVHSGWDAFLGFRGAPKDCIETLVEAVGPDGTVCMPTLPFDGSAIDYAAGDPIFDARRTPSAMGFLTEVFRRGREAVRSRHPTHSVAARGPHASMLIEDHHLAETPCGHGTPWGRLVDVEATVLFLGVPTGTNTLSHGIEALLEAEWRELLGDPAVPIACMTDERYPIRTKLADGSVHVCHTRLYDRRAMRHRRADCAATWLRGTPWFRSTAVRGLSVTALDAAPLLEVARERGRAGEFMLDVEGYRADRG